LARAEIGGSSASSTTLGTVVARIAAIQRLGENGQPRGNARNLELIAGFLDEGLGTARLGRRHKDAVRRVGNVFPGPKDAEF